ncbi:hypothetical protein CPC08DRAFT_767249 [Agrocybe pediades]|nr:hypothetical protein CPC08DRAFT_767249 [Agrocybe pediades]
MYSILTSCEFATAKVLKERPEWEERGNQKSARGKVLVHLVVHTTPLAPVRAPGAVAIPAEALASPAAEDATEEPIYRIHEDGGSVHEVSLTAPRQRQVIDLPPLYSSNLGHHTEPLEDSNAGAH